MTIIKRKTLIIKDRVTNFCSPSTAGISFPNLDMTNFPIKIGIKLEQLWKEQKFFKQETKINAVPNCDTPVIFHVAREVQNIFRDYKKMI